MAVKRFGASIRSLSGRLSVSSTNLLPALLSGILLTLAFPWPALSWLAWVALVPLFYSLRGEVPGKCFLLGFYAGGVHYATLGYWLVPTLRDYGHLPLAAALFFFLVLAAYLALYPALFAMIMGGLRAGPVLCLAAAPMVWVTLEYIRTWLFTGFPWELLGYSQYEQLHLIQIADVTGVYGLSFLIVLVNMTLFYAWLWWSKNKWQENWIKTKTMVETTAVVSVLLAAVLVYGQWRLAEVDGKTDRVDHHHIAVVQGNIDQSLKWEEAFRRATVRKYLSLAAARAEEQTIDLVVMPETAMPFYFSYDQSLAAMVFQGVRDMGVHLLTGAPEFIRRKDGYDMFNSAYLISPEGRPAGRYDKAHLVPFGEYVPFGRWLPMIDSLVANVGDFTAGEAGRVLPMGDVGLGVQICYEIIFPGGSRRLVKNGADMIVNITNDAWYGRTSAPYQHFSMTVLRAVETRRAVVRAANTGISGWVDPAGRIGDTTPLFVDAVRTYPVPEGKGQTVYVRVGDLFAIICVIGALIVVWRRYRTKSFKF